MRAVDQAREAIAIWLAILATHPPAGSSNPASAASRPVVASTGWRSATPSSRPGPIRAGAPATSRRRGAADHSRGLPAGQRDDEPADQKVTHVLKSAWATWLNWHTTDAQLAAALGIRMPAVPAPPAPRGPPNLGRRSCSREGEAAEPAMHGVNPPGAAGAQPESSATAGPPGEAKPAPEVLVTPRSANIPRTEGAPPAVGKPTRHARRPRMSWLRALPLLARPIARTMPWVTLITGCLAGTAFLAVMARVADTSHSPLDQGTVRLAFLPAIAALAFVLRAPFRPLTQATPVPAWLAPAGHIVLAAPVLAVTCWAQLRIMAHTIPPHAPATRPPSTR